VGIGQTTREVPVSVYSDYTPDEQQVLRSGIQAAAVAVSAASVGRGEETVSEGFAAASFVLDSMDAYVGNTLVTSVVLELQREAKSEGHFPDYTVVAVAPDAEAQAMAALRAVVALLDAKAEPDEAAGFRGWLLRIAVITAEAGKEDQGFLGTGGVKVNEAERARLAQIAGILRLKPPDLGR
jgi:hypothetical protein